MKSKPGQNVGRSIPTEIQDWSSFEDLPAGEQDVGFRLGIETTIAYQAPVNFFDALMRTAPGDSPEQTLDERQELREAVVDAMEQLDEQDRFILEAIHAERLSITQLAERLGLERSGHVHRIVKRAEERLRTQLVLSPIIRERISMTTPQLPPAELVVPPRTWDEAARRIVISLAPLEPLMEQHTCVTLINRKIELVRDLVNGGHVGTRPLGGPIVTIGVAAANLLAHKGLWDVDEIVALLCRKQHDYGHGNILSFAQVGVAVRLSDKVARFTNLTSKGVAGAAEPLEDALLDMVGYAVIAQMLMDGTFTLNLDDELFPTAVRLAEAA
jgi:RNA polymerase sigma factor (sigma-70 family)